MQAWHSCCTPPLLTATCTAASAAGSAAEQRSVTRMAQSRCRMHACNLLCASCQLAHRVCSEMQSLTCSAASSRDLPVIVLPAVQQGVWLLTQGRDSDWAWHLRVWLRVVLWPASLRHLSWHGGQLCAAVRGPGTLHRLDWLLSFQSGQQSECCDLMALHWLVNWHCLPAVSLWGSSQS